MTVFAYMFALIAWLNQLTGHAAGQANGSVASLTHR
jgi:hypothetical protein